MSNENKTESANTSKAVTKEKTCFVITPIGSETDPIRRHIDGIIDATICPVLEHYGYNLIIPHRISAPGSITKQIIRDIFKSELVIANLTDKNPNVMYELALRHCFGTPLIMIAEKGTELPFDISDVRTIFYTNDAKGVLELQNDLEKAILNINPEQYTSPIFSILGDMKIEENILTNMQHIENGEKSADALDLILKRLDGMEQSIKSEGMIQKNQLYGIVFYISFASSSYTTEEIIELVRKELSKDLKNMKLKFKWRYDLSKHLIIELYEHSIDVNMTAEHIIIDFCNKYNLSLLTSQRISN